MQLQFDLQCEDAPGECDDSTGLGWDNVTAPVGPHRHVNKLLHKNGPFFCSAGLRGRAYNLLSQNKMAHINCLILLDSLNVVGRQKEPTQR